MPREIDQIPFASNDLSSDFLFEQRKYYLTSSVVYPGENNLPRPVDMWYDRPLWGKVDTKQRLVILEDDSLLPISDDLFVINFVADAYNDFRDFILNARDRLKSSVASFIDVDNPKKAYENTIINYQDYFVDTIEDNFVNAYITDNDRQNIKSFDDYARLYVDFFSVNRDFPHTLCGYLSSPFSSYRTSGLIIEFAEDDYDNDEVKWDKYLSNDFFDDYTRIAASFGFYISRNVPWAIAANLNSKRMKLYMEQYDITNDSDDFTVNYNPAAYVSYVSFKNYMYLSYADFLDRYPVVEKYTVSNCVKPNFTESTYKTRRKLSPRKSEFRIDNVFTDVNFNRFDKQYSDLYFMKLYTKIRLKEEKAYLNKNEYRNLLIKMSSILRSKGIASSISYFSNLLASKRQNKYLSLTNKK